MGIEAKSLKNESIIFGNEGIGQLFLDSTCIIDCKEKSCCIQNKAKKKSLNFSLTLCR